jgi:hypothetical protein
LHGRIFAASELNHTKRQMKAELRGSV